MDFEEVSDPWLLWLEHERIVRNRLREAAMQALAESYAVLARADAALTGAVLALDCDQPSR